MFLEQMITLLSAGHVFIFIWFLLHVIPTGTLRLFPPSRKKAHDQSCNIRGESRARRFLQHKEGPPVLRFHLNRVKIGEVKSYRQTMAFSSFSKKSGKSFSSGVTDSKNISVAATLPEEASAFVPLFDLCEKSKNSLKGTFCKDVILVKNDTTYSAPTIHLSFSYQHLVDLIGESNVKLLIEHYEAVSSLISFPFSDYSSDDADRIILKTRSAYDVETLGLKEGGKVGLVVVPGAYKVGGVIKKPGVYFKIVAFIV